MLAVAFLVIIAPHVSAQTYNPPCYYKSQDGEFTLDFSTLRGKRFVSHGKDPLGKSIHTISHPVTQLTMRKSNVLWILEGVLTGMAIQRADDDSCFVLGQFDSSITPKIGAFLRTPKALNKVQHCLPITALRQVATATCHVSWK